MTSQILSGSALVCIGINDRNFTLWTAALGVTLQLADAGSLPTLATIQEGGIFAFSGTLAGDQTLNAGPAAVAGAVYPRLWYLGSLALTATPVMIPAGSPGPIAVQAQFTLAGNLKGYTGNTNTGNPGPPVFDVVLVGQGVVTASLSGPVNTGTSTLRTVRALSYKFT